MAGLDRKVLNSRRITKLVAPSNPVFSRSFITSFGVAFYKEGAEIWHIQASAPFPLCLWCSSLQPGSMCRDLSRPHFPRQRRKKTALLAPLRKKQYICTAKPIKTEKEMKAYLYKEEEQPIEPIDEHKLAIADQKPEKSDVPKLSIYVVKYKPLWTATIIALVIFVIWALATWLLN